MNTGSIGTISRWKADTQSAARLGARLNRQFGLLHIAENTPDRLGIRIAFGCEADAAGRALQQPYAEPGLEPADDFADGRRRHSQSSGSRREVPLFDDSKKHRHRLLSIHAIYSVSSQIKGKQYGLSR